MSARASCVLCCECRQLTTRADASASVTLARPVTDLASVLNNVTTVFYAALFCRGVGAVTMTITADGKTLVAAAGACGGENAWAHVRGTATYVQGVTAPGDMPDPYSVTTSVIIGGE